MKLVYAELWLKKYIKHNYGKYDGKTFNRKLNWAIVNISHRVFKSRGRRGHDTRQEIRKKLWEYSRIEIRTYQQVHQPTLIDRIVSFFRRL